MDFLVWIIAVVFLPPVFLIVAAIATNTCMPKSGSKNSNRDLFILLAVLSITLAAVTGLLGYFGKL